MKLLFIVREFPKLSETFIISQVVGFIGLGHHVSVISLKKPKIPYDIPGFDISVINLGISSNTFRKAVKMIRFSPAWIFSPDFLRFNILCNNPLSKYLYKPYRDGVFDSIDIIIIHFGDLAKDFSFLRDKLKMNIPCAVVFHGVDVARHLPALNEQDRTRLWKFITIGLPVSKYWKERLIELGCPEEKLRVLHMGVDIDTFTFRKRSPNTCPRFLSVCRLVEKKGVDTALKALAILKGRKKDFNFNYDIVGEGPMMDDLKNRAVALGINNNVEFHGRKSSNEVREFFNSADIYLLPSKKADNGDMEGIPVSIMEAMAMGLPAISTYHSGIPELIRNNISGLLVKENDLTALADAIYKMVFETDLAEKLSIAARKTIEREFNIEHQMQNIETIFKDIK